MHVLKAHAYGNDFLFVEGGQVRGEAADLARRLCDRHRGIGGDGLALYRLTGPGADMQLFNPDGSVAEVSGNGVRCLAALVVRARRAAAPEDALFLAAQGLSPVYACDTVPGASVVISTGAGEKRLSLLGIEGTRYSFRAAMGAPSDIREMELDVGGERLRVIALTVGNPQCVLLRSGIDEALLRRLGPALERHPCFPARTNVEFAEVVSPGRVRILIWERGVGPTLSSGTGSCAAAVAAAAYGGARRDLEVTAPGGSQRVEWREDSLYLTGWAEPLFDAQWMA